MSVVVRDASESSSGLSPASRVVFLVEAPLGHRDFRRLGVGPLLEEGFDVRVVDLTMLLQPRIADGEGREALAVEVSVPESIADAARLIRGLVAPGTLFVCLIGYSLRSLPLFRALGRRARYALLATNALPYGHTANRGWSRLRDRLRPRRLSGLVASTFFRLPTALWGVGEAEVVIAGGRKSLTPFETRLAGPGTRVVWAHALDFDLLLAEGAAAPEEPTHIVFLDQFLTGHPDQWQHGHPFCDPSTYFLNLCAAFEDAERSLGLPVVVAAHPRSDYDEWDPRFGGRRVVCGDTLRLIRDARLVLAHDSTAVGIAVHFERPVCFITDDAIQLSDVRRESANGMAAWLGETVHNLDRGPVPSWTRALEFDVEKYRAYREAFLKVPDSPERPSWSIFADYLRGHAQPARLGTSAP